MVDNFILDSFWGANSIYTHHQLYQELKKPLFHIKDIGLTQRIVMHWDNYGLLNIKRENNEEWRKFSFKDYTWLHLIQEMRNMGVPLDTIKKVKDTVLDEITQTELVQILFEQIDEIEKMENEQEKSDLKVAMALFDPEKDDPSNNLSSLSIAISYSLGGKRNVSLVVFNDGTCLFPFDESRRAEYPAETLQKLTYETHITVSLTNILRNFLTSERSTYILPKLNILNEQQMQVLDIINSGEYTAVKISFQNKEINSVELTKEQDPKRMIVDVLTESSFQDIEIIRRNGVIVKVVNTQKIRFDK